jgi:two-component system CitB family sensor kinase
MTHRHRFRPVTLSAQVLAIQLVIVVVTLVAVGVSGFVHVRDTLHDQYGERALAVARTVANLPETHAALESGDPDGELQALVDGVIRVETGMTYIAVADRDGIRLTHPNPDRIGERLSTDPSAVLAGTTTISTETGTLGPTVRAKVPVLGNDGSVIGLVSVGVSTSEISRHTWRSQRPVLALGVAALTIGVVASVFVARRVRRTTFGLAPREIATLYEHREAMLLAIREGVVTLDADGRITLINDEACRLLGLDGDVEGRQLRDVVKSVQLTAVLDGRSSEGGATVVSGGRVLLVSRRAVSVRGREIGEVITLRDRTELEGLASELASVKGMADSLRAKTHDYSNRMHTIAGLIELGRLAEAGRFATSESSIAQALSESYAQELGDPMLVALLMAKAAVAAERGIAMRIERDDTMMHARLVEAHDAVTVVGNLIDNAFDAVVAGDGDGAVDVDLRADGSSLVVTVSDSGPGVAPEDAGRIFEYGFTTKSNGAGAPGRTGWRGIGLALVVESAQRHGGSVTLVDGQPGRGAVFRVTLHDMLVDAEELVGR